MIDRLKIVLTFVGIIIYCALLCLYIAAPMIQEPKLFILMGGHLLFEIVLYVIIGKTTYSILLEGLPYE